MKSTIKRYYSQKELRGMLDVSQTTLNKLIIETNTKTIETGKGYKIDARHVQSLIDANWTRLNKKAQLIF